MEETEMREMKRDKQGVSEGRYEGELKWLFGAAVACFLVAAVAGVYFRYGQAFGFHEAIGAANLRHGHSHLMLMGWGTPALMALMARRWWKEGGRSYRRGVLLSGWSSLGLSVASFPAFVLWGYGKVAVGTPELPLAAILSGLAMFGWYGFGVVFGLATKGWRGPAWRLMRWSVWALVVSSLGAWAVAGVMMSGVESVFWEAFAIHFFVELFGAGWLILGVVGLLRAEVGDVPETTGESWGRRFIGGAVGFVFLLSLPGGHTPEVLPLIGGLAAGVVGTGFFLVVNAFGGRLEGWAVVVRRFLWVMMAMMGAMAIPAVARWGLGANLRILFLHVIFLGVLTVGLVVLGRRAFGEGVTGHPAGWVVGVLGLLGTLVMMTGLMPAGWMGRWVILVVLAGALGGVVGPVLSILVANVRCAFFGSEPTR